MALVRRTRTYPLAFGLQSKVDARALQPPSLTICRNAEFDEEGGLQTRKPFSAMSMGIFNSAEVITEARRLAVYEDELLLFTRDDLYSWSERDQEWLSKQQYLAPKVTERSAFVRSGDQVFADQAVLGGVVATIWTEITSTGTVNYLAATDQATGAVILGPTVLAGGAITSPSRPKIVALTSGFLITLFVAGSANFYAIRLTPGNMTAAAVAAAIAAPTTLLTATAAGPNDVVVQGGVAWIGMRGNAGGNHHLIRIDDTMVFTTNNKGGREAQRIAVAISPAAGTLFVIRYDGTDVVADRINPATLADVSINGVLGAAPGAQPNQITAAVRSATNGGQFRCYAYWSVGEQSSITSETTTFRTDTNYIDTAGAIGPLSRVCRRLGVASRAFDHDGITYVWLVFASESQASGMGEPLGVRAQFQNTYYLYRDAATNDTSIPIAKATLGRAGGFQATGGHLPYVQNTADDVYEWAGVERRIIPLSDARDRVGVQLGYSDRGPRSIRLEFDADESRRAVTLGRTLYVAGSFLQQYDGEGMVEVGFHVFPWYFANVAVGSGSLTAGTRSYKSTLSWPNAKGELDRCTTATGTALTFAAGQLADFGSNQSNLYVTARRPPRHLPAIEIWRTTAGSVLESLFHLITSKDPAVTSNPNRYIANDHTAGLVATFTDNLTDDLLEKREFFPENESALESLQAPPATVIVATQDRLLLAGIGDSPYQLRYSKLRGADEIAAFNDILSVDLPPQGGPITALGFQQETLVAFKERAVFSMPGDGFNNRGEGSNYGPARLLASDVGAVSQEAVALTPRGLFFKSLKGWYLQAGWAPPIYVGGPVAAFDSDVVKAVHVVESQHQVRVVTDQRILVWDYETNRDAGGAWSEWPVGSLLDGVIWRGRQVLLTSADQVLVQDEDFSSGLADGLDAQTPFLKPEDLQGEMRVWWLMVLGECMSACRLRVRLRRNYDVNGTYFDDRFHTPVVGQPLQVRHSPSIQRCQSIQVRVTAVRIDDDSLPPPGEAVKLTGISLEYGVDAGLFRQLNPSQKQ